MRDEGWQLRVNVQDILVSSVRENGVITSVIVEAKHSLTLENRVMLDLETQRSARIILEPKWYWEFNVNQIYKSRIGRMHANWHVLQQTRGMVTPYLSALHTSHWIRKENHTYSIRSSGFERVMVVYD